MRMRTKWFKNHGERTTDETSSALGFIFWQISIDRLKSLRKADIGVFSPQQSIDILREISMFLIHNADRIIHERFSAEERAELLQKLAVHVADNYAGNALDALGSGDYKNEYISRLNERLSEYSAIIGSGEGLRFSLSRTLGAHAEAIVPEKDKPWVAQQLIEIEIPEVFDKFDRACGSLLLLGDG